LPVLTRELNARRNEITIMHERAEKRIYPLDDFEPPVPRPPRADKRTTQVLNFAAIMNLLIQEKAKQSRRVPIITRSMAKPITIEKKNQEGITPVFKTGIQIEKYIKTQEEISVQLLLERGKSIKIIRKVDK
jgi:hypothetical protein